MDRKTLTLSVKMMVTLGLMIFTDRYIGIGPTKQFLGISIFWYFSWSFVANQHRLPPGLAVPKWVAYLCGFPNEKRVDTRTLALQLSALASSLLAFIAVIISPAQVLPFALLGGGSAAVLVMIWASTQDIDNNKSS